MWVGGSIKSFIVANTPPPMSTIPRGRQPGAARPAAGSRQPARHVGHVGHVAGEFGPAGNRLNGRQPGAGSYQLHGHGPASYRAGSGRLDAIVHKV
jgi:hypothetical protein